jgi:hypothetical protein
VVSGRTATNRTAEAQVSSNSAVDDEHVLLSLSFEARVFDEARIPVLEHTQENDERAEVGDRPCSAVSVRLRDEPVMN